MSLEGNLITSFKIFVQAQIEGVIVVFILGSDRVEINDFTLSIFVGYE